VWQTPARRWARRSAWRSGRAPVPASSTERRRALHVLITRPREQALELAQQLAARGDTALIEPLLNIERLPGVPPDLAGVQALVLTSANAAPALSAPARQLPLFAVGDATANAAKAAGCRTVIAATGTGADLARLIARRCRPERGALLHLSGEEVRPGLAEELAAAGFDLRRQVVYRTVPARALSAPTVEALAQRQIEAVLLFSPRTAQTFVELIAWHGLRDHLAATAAICLSAAVAEPCRELVWRAIHLAAQPELGALLEALEAARRRC
jgi:uroporphyrinogen-III synthase